MMLQQESLSPTKSRNSAKYYIERYFSCKSAFDQDLLDEKYIDLCMDTDMCSGVDRAYDAMKASSLFVDEDENSPIEKDVKFVLKTLQGMSRIVPQEFSAGILLMHLHFIEKVCVQGL